jgi:hypothetical protein
MNELNKIRAKLVDHNTRLKARLEASVRSNQHYNDILTELTDDMNQAKSNLVIWNEKLTKLQQSRDALKAELEKCENKRCEEATKFELSKIVSQGNKVMSDISVAEDRYKYNQSKLTRLKLVYDEMLEQTNDYKEQHDLLQKTYEDTDELLKVIDNLSKNNTTIAKSDVAATKSQFDELQSRIGQLNKETKMSEASPWIDKLNKSFDLLEGQLKGIGDMSIKQIPNRFFDEEERQWVKNQIVPIVQQTLLQLRSARDVAIYNLEQKVGSPPIVVDETVTVATNKFENARSRIDSILHHSVKEIKQSQSQIASALNSTQPDIPTVEKTMHKTQTQIAELSKAVTSDKDLLPVKDQHNSLLEKVTQIKEEKNPSKTIVIQIDNDADDEKLLDQVTRDRLQQMNSQVKEKAIMLRNQREKMIRLGDLYTSSLNKSEWLKKKLADDWTSSSSKLLSAADVADAQRKTQRALQDRLEELEKSVSVSSTTTTADTLLSKQPFTQNEEADAMKNFQRFATIHSEPYILMVVIGMNTRLVMTKIINTIYNYKQLIDERFQLSINRYTLYDNNNQVYVSDEVSSIDDAFKLSRFHSMEKKNFILSIDYGSPHLSNVIHFYIMNYIVSDFGQSNIQNLYSDPRIIGSKLNAQIKSRSFTQFNTLVLPPTDPTNFNKKLLKFASDITLLESSK